MTAVVEEYSVEDSVKNSFVFNVDGEDSFVDVVDKYVDLEDNSIGEDDGISSVELEEIYVLKLL